MPINGFSKMIEQMLKHPKINLIKHKPQITFKNNETYINKQLVNTPIFYCGEVDKLLNYQYGKIPYRSLYFKFQTKQIDSFQPADVINYPNHPTITRVAEYKKINNQKIKDITTISYEYPGAYNINSTKFNKPYYPIHNPKNLLKYQKYVEHLQKYPNFYLLGRLAEYKYFDMDDAIDNAMSKFDNIKNKLKKH
jgi:UDP-galactopyranose mutase